MRTLQQIQRQDNLGYAQARRVQIIEQEQENTLKSSIKTTTITINEDALRKPKDKSPNKVGLASLTNEQIAMMALTQTRTIEMDADMYDELMKRMESSRAVFAGPTMQAHCCEVHSEDDKAEFVTCPICLMYIHHRTCEELHRLRDILKSFPGFDAPTAIGDRWIEIMRAIIK